MNYQERQRAREEWHARAAEVLAEALQQIEKHKAHIRLLAQESSS